MTSVVLLLSVDDCDGENWVADVKELASEEGEMGVSPVGETSALALEDAEMEGAPTPTL
jgi:hypothetical protein